MRVEQIMTREPAVCTPDDTIQSVAILMRDLGVGAIPVVADRERGQPIGIVTDRDLCCAALASGADPITARVADFMTPAPTCCRPGDDVERAAELMRLRRVRRIPVVDDEVRCCGIVTTADLAMKVPEGTVALTLVRISLPAEPAPPTVSTPGAA